MNKVITILLVFLLWVCFVNAQCPKKDTIVYNQFRDYVEWSKSHQKKTLEDFENEKYQMIYFDKVIIDKKNHKIYLYGSYDLSWSNEIGIGINFNIKTKKKKKVMSWICRYCGFYTKKQDK